MRKVYAFPGAVIIEASRCTESTRIFQKSIGIKGIKVMFKDKFPIFIKVYFFQVLFSPFQLIFSIVTSFHFLVNGFFRFLSQFFSPLFYFPSGGVFLRKLLFFLIFYTHHSIVIFILSHLITSLKQKNYKLYCKNHNAMV